MKQIMKHFMYTIMSTPLSLVTSVAQGGAASWFVNACTRSRNRTPSKFAWKKSTNPGCTSIKGQHRSRIMQLKPVMLFLIFPFVLSVPMPVAATTYFVNASQGTDSSSCLTSPGPGSSACQTIMYVFNKVDLVGGDTVEVEEGTYYETVTPGANDSGENGNPVILRAKSGDKVTIDGGNSRADAFDLSNRNYISVDGFYTDNVTGKSILVHYTNGITVRNCNVNIPPGLSGNPKGMDFYYSDDAIAEYNTIQTEGVSVGQTDGMQVAVCRRPIIRYNSITISNPYEGPHDDGIQLGSCQDVQIYGNYINMAVPNINWRQGLWMATEGSWPTPDNNAGTWYVYNNVIEGYFGTYALQIMDKTGIGIDLHVYNNTVVTYGTSRSMAFRTTTSNAYVKNNIFVNTDRGAPAATFDSLTQIPSRIDHNAYYSPNNQPVAFGTGGGAWRTWSWWQGEGYDANGINQDPSLDSALRPNNANDPVIDVGVELSSYFTTAKDGISRGQGSGWDIGAYEYLFISSPSSPSSPKNLTIVSVD